MSPSTSDKIVAIRIVGNKTTQARIILQEMVVQPGSVADPRAIERSRQAVMDLGLFKSVRTELLPAPGGKLLQVSVEEKYYLLPIPRLDRNSDGDVTYGVDLRADNLGGLNQSLKLSRTATRYSAQADTGQDLSLDYSYPRMFGSPYRLDFNISHAIWPDTAIADNPGLFQHKSFSSRIGVSRLLNATGPSRGWSLGGGLVWRREDYRSDSGAPVPWGYAGKAFGIAASADYYDVRDLLYTRSGSQYGYSLEVGGAFTGSDYAYARHVMYYRRYTPFGAEPYSNINLNLSAGFSTGRLFGFDTFSLGGSSTLRGYSSETVTGASYALANIEYLRPIFGQRFLRLALFTDIGNAYPENRAFDLTRLHAAAGIGLRWKLKAFVKADLRLDVAYGNSVDGIKVYGATHLPF